MSSNTESRTLKRWLLIGVGVVVLLIGVLVALVATMDLEGFMRARLGVVEAATGRSLQVGGKLSVRLFPRIVVIAEDVRFANAKWGSQPDMLRVKRVEGILALAPLFRRQIEVAKLELIEPDVLVETDASGISNWDLKGTQSKPTSGASGTGDAFGISAPSVTVSDGKITLREKGKPPQQLAIEHFEISRSDEATDDVELKATWRDQPFTVKGTIGNVERLLTKDPKWPLDLTLAMPGTDVKFAGHLDHSAKTIAINGRIAADVREFAALAKVAGTPLDLPTPLKLDATLTAAADMQRIDPMVLQVGKTAVEGSAAINSAGAKPRITARLASKELDLRPADKAAAAPSGKAASSASGRLFSDAKLPFAALNTVDADVDVRLDRLRLPNGVEVANVRTRGVLANGRLVAEPIALNLAQGSVNGRLEVQATAPRSTLKIDAKQVSLPTLMAQLGRPNQMTGGPTDVAADLSLAGESTQAMAASATGTLRVSIGPAHLPASLPLSDITASVFDAIYPGRRTSGTELTCAVVVLPLKSGVATIDRSIAIETSNFDVIASGTVDLRSEQIDLSLRPVVKRGLGVGTLNLAQFVRVSGPLTAPKIGVGQKELLAGALSIGAAAYTGGLSLLGERLLKQASDPNPCRTALAGKPPPEATPAAPSAAPSNPADLLKGLFGRR